MEPEHKNKDYLFVLTSVWIAFMVMLKFLEHQQAFNKIKVGFRVDLFIILPLLLIFTIYILWKHWDDLGDDSK